MQMSGFDLFNGTAHSGIGVGYDPDFIASFDRYYGRINPFAFGDPPIGRTFALDQVVPHDVILGTEFWADWLRPQEDLSAGGGLLLPAGPGRIVSFGGGIRRRDQDALEGPFLELIEAIRPLVAQAIATNEALSALRLEACLLRQGVEPVGAAVLVLGKDRRLLSLNGRAEDLIADRRVMILGAGGRVGLSDSRADSRLEGCMQGRTGLGELHFTDRDGTGVTGHVVRVDGRVADLIPFPKSVFAAPPVFVLVITSDLAAGDPVALIARKTGLTRSEAAIALAIAEGASPAEIAGQRGRSLHTIKNQLQAVYEKTGSHRQADLVRLVERIRRGG
ncbi:helix-turn-helix transcriptional regulator [Maliponia aquimaris]|nr:helix-turn-helix transcriptional regulator [Maliponia aquimaris]